MERFKVTCCQVKSLYVSLLVHTKPCCCLPAGLICAWGKKESNPGFSLSKRQSLQRTENDDDSLTPPQKASHRGVQPRASPRGNATSENVKHLASPQMPAYHRPRSLPGRCGKAQSPPATRAPARSGPHQPLGSITSSGRQSGGRLRQTPLLFPHLKPPPPQ